MYRHISTYFIYIYLHMYVYIYICIYIPSNFLRGYCTSYKEVSGSQAPQASRRNRRFQRWKSTRRFLGLGAVGRPWIPSMGGFNKSNPAGIGIFSINDAWLAGESLNMQVYSWEEHLEIGAFSSKSCLCDYQRVWLATIW